MDFTERALMSLWEVLGGEEVRPKVFTMENARKFYFEKRIEYPQAQNCVLKVTPHGKGYEIVQILVDENMKMIYLSNDICVGRRIVAESISVDVKNFLGGESYKLME